MCGIAGRVGGRPLGEKAWEGVLGVMAHRGPDGLGLATFPGAGLAHVRLSIQDASEAGRQPMTDPTGRYTIVYNGEVYNDGKIRSGLEAEGLVFRSRTDTEVVLASFIRKGPACLSDFSGMFAFAVWDELEKTLFLARDRLGVKPLYYAEKGGVFYFASEINAILKMGFGPVEPDPAAAAYFLQFRHNDLSETIVRGVRRFPPGCFAFYRKGRVEIKSWWRIPPARPEPARDRPALLRGLLSDAVAENLRGDVPVGLFLSGGVDSSGLLALMSRGKEPVETFCAALPGLSAARGIPALVRRFGNRHAEVPVDVSAAGLLARIVWHFGELNADPAAIPLYLLAERAAGSVKAVCSGEGADELFAGYERLYILHHARRLGGIFPRAALLALPRILKRVPPDWGNLVFRYFSILVPEGLGRLDRFLRDLDDPRRSYLALESVLLPSEMRGLILPRHLSEFSLERLAENLMEPWFTPGGSVSEALSFEMANRLSTDLLMKCDAMTMAHGLECRVPYLDHRLVEAALSVPLSENLGLFQNKRALRAALAPLLPEDAARRPKENFFVPIHAWLAALDPWVRELLSERAVARQGMFDPGKVREMVEKYRAGKLFWARAVWNLVNYALWHEIYVENGGRKPGEEFLPGGAIF